VGSVSLMTGSPRASILAILVLFVAGAVLLARVDVQRGTELARQASRNSARPASS
jgi:MFS-type transporter involved in bile tolerance (Atg22 family)